MKIDTASIVSVTEANQNFSRVAKLAESRGRAVIFKNNRPKFLLIDLEKEPFLDLTEEEKIDIAVARVLQRYRPALEELAK